MFPFSFGEKVPEGRMRVAGSGLMSVERFAIAGPFYVSLTPHLPNSLSQRERGLASGSGG
jgi:hypothetical protein